MSQERTGTVPEEDAISARRRRGIFFLSLAFAAVGFAMMLQVGLQDNFLVEQLHFQGSDKGLVEASREMCGITALGLLAVLAGLTEPIIAAIMLVIVGIGLGCYAGVYSFWPLVAMSVIWSQGLHVWMPLPNSMMLSLAEPGQAGRRLGQMQSMGAIGSAIGLGVALALTIAGGHFHFASPIRPMYVLAGAVAVLGGVACLMIPRDIKAPGQRLVFRAKYGLYYLLSFLEGWRKQIFIAFAGFLLVDKYQTPLWMMLTLWMVIQALTWIVSPHVGRFIDRVGERRVLVIYYVSVTCIFCGYALVPGGSVASAYILRGLFVLDNAFFCLALALVTYVRRLAPPSEHTATLSMGVAMNHIAAVLMPLAGAALWKYAGYRWVFGAGAAAAVVSIFVAARVPMHLMPNREAGPAPVKLPEAATPSDKG